MNNILSWNTLLVLADANNNHNQLFRVLLNMIPNRPTIRIFDTIIDSILRNGNLRHIVYTLMAAPMAQKNEKSKFQN